MQIRKKTKRDREDYATNASTRHREVGEVLNNGIFRNMIVYQEYPVSLINPECANNRYRVDWYIKNLNIAIEVHGEHHYKPTTYGGQALDDATRTYRKQVFKDIQKIQFLEAVKCAIIEIDPDTEISEANLLLLIKEHSQRLTDQSSK